MSHGTIPFNRDLPLAEAYDVVVCGGGAAGVPAALSAARAGARVLLVEAQAQLGGMGTSGLVSHWLGGRTPEGRWVVGGLLRTLAEDAASRGIALIPTMPEGETYQPHGWHPSLIHGIPFDPHAMARLLDEKILAAGVDLLLLTQMVDVELEHDRVTHVVLHNKGGLHAVPTHAVVDATGDADVAARSGCAVVKGRDEDGLMTPATLEFHVDNVDQRALAAYIREHDAPRFRALIRDLRERGIWTFPYEIFICVQLQQEGTMVINTPRICGVDGTDAASLTDGIVRGREEALRLFGIMREHFPGFAQARLKGVAPLLGVRETRRIVGEYVLTVDDLAAGRAFADTIGLSSYSWDLPDPKKPSCQPMTERRAKKAPITPIPYRVMVPRPVENVICPGRAISVERDVLGPLREMGPCFAMGEAAGEAAARVARTGDAFKDVDTDALRSALAAHGAILSPDDIAPC